MKLPLLFQNYALFLLATFAGSQASSKVHLRHSEWNRIQPVDSVDISSYTGRWYQVYANNVVKYTFELGGYCATADYAEVEGGISVHNAQNYLAPNGTISTIDGVAFARNASAPAKLTVEFDTVPFPGSYWIIKLGPVVDDQYQYSIVTDRFGVTLFVLARNVDDFKRLYEAEVLEYLTPLFSGFLRKPRESFQSDECVYSPPPSVLPSENVQQQQEKEEVKFDLDMEQDARNVINAQELQADIVSVN